MIQKVGRDFIYDEKKGKTRKFSYLDVIYDQDKWAEAKKYRPEYFELVLLKMKDEKIKKGWYSGTKWDGLNIKQGEKVIYWKRCPYDRDLV